VRPLDVPDGRPNDHLAAELRFEARKLGSPRLTEGEIAFRRQRRRVAVGAILARFESKKHRHELVFDLDLAGTETD
jgi:hypothetical protein